jgi:hypothetical protein
MTQASLDATPVLPDRECQGNPALPNRSVADPSALDLALAELETRAVRDLVRDDAQQRRSDMEAAIGLWAERSDLVDPDAYLRNLRDDDRPQRSHCT